MGKIGYYGYGDSSFLLYIAKRAYCLRYIYFCVQQIVNPYKGRGVTYIDMKRTIYTFIACLSAFAMPATAASYDLVTSNADKTGQASMSSNTANAYTRGFVFSLGSDWFSQPCKAVVATRPPCRQMCC